MMMKEYSFFLIPMLGFLSLTVQETCGNSDIPINDYMSAQRPYAGLVRIRVPFTEVNIDRTAAGQLTAKYINIDVGPFFKLTKHDRGTVIQIPFLQNLFSLGSPPRNHLTMTHNDVANHR